TVDSKWFTFFFQAEDGIRDFHVTGVQTCALPISRGAGQCSDDWMRLTTPEHGSDEIMDENKMNAVEAMPDPSRRKFLNSAALAEIGRASCRERGWGTGGAGAARARRVHGVSA